MLYNLYAKISFQNKSFHTVPLSFTSHSALQYSLHLLVIRLFYESTSECDKLILADFVSPEREIEDENIGRNHNPIGLL